ncbi:hypothetical protein LTR91_020168 [Friedmanniomyces endolithicus]|uniref:Uncharacterized protein n=1 Tax=Friedmanniomyces endolithicus TaxID=329885 RepID=A0AAN6FA03_9PEZI|nr:hypothetical protein LTR35_011804 [Friedmanniomyces endolithicus]KAK0276654.1 hypothetical protein LTS00_014507 [Friedmanniomyces endolithicus]KAK0309130.1 hypothetical protein LTR82_015297 [Friedmanniomyces endolithicus]KAK0919817.1 hypothetical protein LTR57_010442 [Friedmanniomyces endolithicus]KAK0960842.1 hypothetical protein LTR91_020168 [Friedmanniomyces endolithicus]
MPAYSLVCHLYAKDDPEAIKKLTAKLQEASQTYTKDKETLNWSLHFQISSRGSVRHTLPPRTGNFQTGADFPSHLRRYWQTFDKYVIPLLDKPMDLRRYNELDTSTEVKVEQDPALWEAVKKHQSQN